MRDRSPWVPQPNRKCRCGKTVAPPDRSRPQTGKQSFKPGSLDLLTKALALVIGTEAMIVFKDVLQLDDASARKVRRWAIRALVDAARNPNVQK